MTDKCHPWGKREKKKRCEQCRTLSLFVVSKHIKSSTAQWVAKAAAKPHFSVIKHMHYVTRLATLIINQSLFYLLLLLHSVAVPYRKEQQPVEIN